MSYPDFLNTLGYGISLFFDTLVSLSNSLLSNYIVITILGLTLFCSMILYLLDLVFGISFFGSKKRDLDNVGGGK